MRGTCPKSLRLAGYRSGGPEFCRNERRPDSRYSSPRQVAFEVRAAESLFERHGIPFIDATEVSIEEISSRILDRTGIERRLRP